MIICSQDCEILNDTMMLCRTPNTKTTSDSISRRKKREVGPLGEASFGFIIADVSDLLTWSEDNNVTMEYFPDPEYFPFEENPRKTKGGGSVEQIEVSKLLNVLLHCIILYCFVLYCIVLYCILLLYYIVLHCKDKRNEKTKLMKFFCKWCPSG